MKLTKRLKTGLLTGLAAALVLCASAGTSMSYFTTYVTAAGSETLKLKTTIPDVEETGDKVKVVKVKNNAGEDGLPCYVRVKYFAPELIPCTVTAGEGWAKGSDGYWYYAQPLAPGAGAPDLTITPAVPEDLEQDSFNIAVIVESAPLLYDDKGELKANNESYDGWGLKAETGTAAGTD